MRLLRDVKKHVFGVMKQTITGLALLLALASLLAPANGAEVLGQAFCDLQRDPEAASACLDYVNSGSSITKWTSAVKWSRYHPGSYQCANITALCLMKDMHAERPGSSCVPAMNNGPCELDAGGMGACWMGNCVGPEEAAINMLLTKEDYYKPPQQQPALRQLQQQQEQQASVPGQPAGVTQQQQQLGQQQEQQQLGQPQPQQQVQQVAPQQAGLQQQAVLQQVQPSQEQQQPQVPMQQQQQPLAATTASATPLLQQQQLPEPAAPAVQQQQHQYVLEQAQVLQPQQQFDPMLQPQQQVVTQEAAAQPVVPPDPALQQQQQPAVPPDPALQQQQQQPVPIDPALQQQQQQQQALPPDPALQQQQQALQPDPALQQQQQPAVPPDPPLQQQPAVPPDPALLQQQQQQALPPDAALQQQQQQQQAVPADPLQQQQPAVPPYPALQQQQPTVPLDPALLKPQQQQQVLAQPTGSTDSSLGYTPPLPNMRLAAAAGPSAHNVTGVAAAPAAAYRRTLLVENKASSSKSDKHKDWPTVGSLLREQAQQPTAGSGTAAVPAAAGSGSGAAAAPVPAAAVGEPAGQQQQQDNYEYDDLAKAAVGDLGDDIGDDFGGRNGGSNGGRGGSSGAAEGLEEQQEEEELQDTGAVTVNGKRQFQLDPQDPYGLGVDFGNNAKINEPFGPAAPPSPPPAPSPKPSPPEPTRGRLTLDIQPDSFMQAVPPAFVGVSREWTPFVWYDENLEAFEKVFEQLGPSPILRIGGATQEGLTKLPDTKFMTGLVKLHCRLGVRYIIGLPLFQNAPQVALAFKSLFDAVFKDYPFAIVSYELGNEPNFWPTRAGGFTQVNGGTSCTSVQMNNPAYQLVGSLDTPADRDNEGFAVYREAQEPYLPYRPQSYCYTPQATVFAAGVDNFNTYFQRAANALTGCGGLTQDFQATWGWPYWGPPGFNRKVLSGPAWGDFSMDLNAFRTFLFNSNQCYLNEASMHYYGPNRATTFEDLFNKLSAVSSSVTPPRSLISTAKDFIQAARLYNTTLRVSEANSVPDGGQSGLSNTIGAAIWTLVTALEFAQAGASGINFHWGDGGSPTRGRGAPAYVGVETAFRNDTVRTPYPLVRVPFYGYVMYSRALGNNGPGIFLNFSSDAVVSACREFFYTYAILVPHAGMISVVAANANPNVTCYVTATLPGVSTTSATVQLLQGPRGGNLSAVEGISLAGQTYQGQVDGTMRGDFNPQVVPPHAHDIRSTGWTFNVPPASAALLQIPLSGGSSFGVGQGAETPNLVSPGGTQEAVDPLTAAWSPPVAVPFPATIGNFPPDPDSNPDGQGEEEQRPPQALLDGDAGPAEPGASSGGGAPGGGGSTSPAAAAVSQLFEFKSNGSQAAQEGAADKGPAAAGAAAGPTGPQGQTAAPAAAAPPAAAAGMQYVFKGYSADGRPMYVRRAGSRAASTQEQQQQQQQQQEQVQQHLRLAGKEVPSAQSSSSSAARVVASPYRRVSSIGGVSSSSIGGISGSSTNSSRNSSSSSQQDTAGRDSSSSFKAPGKPRSLLGWFPALPKWRRGAGSSNMRVSSAGAGDLQNVAAFTPGAAAAGAAAGSSDGLLQQQQQLAAAGGWGASGPIGQADGGLGFMQYGVQYGGGTGYAAAEAAGSGWGSLSSSSSSSPGAAAAGLEAGKYGSLSLGGSSIGSLGGVGVGGGLLPGSFGLSGAGMAAGGTVGAGFGSTGSSTAAPYNVGVGVNAGPTAAAGAGTAAAAAGANGTDVNVNIRVNPGALAGAAAGAQGPQGAAAVQQQVPQVQYQNPNLNFIPPRATVTPQTQAVPQSAAAEWQQPGLNGVGLVWPPAGGVAGNSAQGTTAALGVGVPGLGGYQLLPPGFDEAAVKRAAEVCPGIQRIYAIQARAGVRGDSSSSPGDAS